MAVIDSTNGRNVCDFISNSYERRCWLLEALKLAPLGEALQIAKSAEAFLTSDEYQADRGRRC